METKKIPLPGQTVRATENKIDKDIITHFYITLHPNIFPTRESFKLGLITNWFKHNAHSTQHTIEEILQFSSQGRCYMPCYAYTEDDNYYFVSSKLILVDVDDDECVTDPVQVLEQLKDICAGLFYTSSHGIKGNRYRLLIPLDDSIRDEREYIKINELLVKKLKIQGIPADSNSSGATQRVRTAMNGYILSNPNARLCVADYRKEVAAELEEERKRQAAKVIEFANRKDSFVYSLEELKERAKAIGYVDDYKEWERLGYSLKSYVDEGHITDGEGYEVFEILCGGNDESTYWDRMRARGGGNGGLTIATFIGRSNEAGFKRNFKYYHAVSNKQYKANIETITFPKYISAEFAKSVLEQTNKALIKAPTGSGKTTSFIDAALQLQKEMDFPSRYYIVAVPTRAITEQQASSDVLAITGDTKNIYQKLKKHSDDRKRVIAVTYDMAEAVTDMIKSINAFSSFSYIIDEFHQLTHGFNYRREAIESLFGLRHKAKSFIGLSGTIDDILRTEFDKEIHVQTDHSKAPCRVWGAITYRKKTDEEPQLVQLITQKANNNKRLLVFIQSKNTITRVRDILRKKGIKVATITSESKKNNDAYNYIVQKSEFPPGIQVILSTTVLSDGININNVRKNERGEVIFRPNGSIAADLSFECIVLCSQQSPNFNVSMVRQMANRFRLEYGAFNIFMQQAFKETKYLYNIDQAHKYECQLAQNVVNLIEREFSEKGASRLYRKGIIEKRYDIKFNDEEVAGYNELLIRHNVSNEKTTFYAIFRNQFIEALEKLMGEPPAESIDISAYLEREEIDYTDIVEEINAVVEEKKMTQKEMAAKIEETYTPFVHKAILEGNPEALSNFKKVAATHHYSAIQEIAPIVEDYQTALKLVKQVKRIADVKAFKSRVDALLDIYYYSRIHRKTATKEAFLALTEHTGVAMTKQELDDVVATIAKRFKRSKKVDVEKISKHFFFHEHTRTKKERFTTLHVLEKNHVLNEFSLTSDEFDLIMHKFINQEDQLQQIVFERFI